MGSKVMVVVWYSDFGMVLSAASMIRVRSGVEC